MVESPLPPILRPWRLSNKRLNGWIASLFMVGAALFALGCVLFLLGSGDELLLDGIFFAGSLFFTSAAYCQLHQLLTDRLGVTKSRTQWVRQACNRETVDLSLMSAFAQFIGTLMFNVNTFDAFFDFNWFVQNLLVWSPNILGSILFQLSGSLAIYEVSGRRWSWPSFKQRHDLLWWIGAINFIGCIAFLLSALCSFVVPQVTLLRLVNGAVMLTLLGACCFFVAAFLMWPAMRVEDNK